MKLRPQDPASPTIPCILIILGRTKTTSAGDGVFVFAAGRAAEALDQWMQYSGINAGLIFREVRNDGTIGTNPLSPQTINFILTTRCQMVGLDLADFSAHCLRSGFLTQAAHNGIPLVDAMRESSHKSVQQASRYYDGQEHEQILTVRIIV